MPHTRRKRYAVVSCHVERPLDDAVWSRFSALQERRPGGFRSPRSCGRPMRRAGEDEGWLERAQEAAAHGPLGHHTHWTAPDHARPTRTADRASACSPRAAGCASSGSRRRSSAEAAGTPTPTSRRRVPSSATSTARPAPVAPRTSRTASRGRRWPSQRGSGSRRSGCSRRPDDPLARRPRARARAPVAASARPRLLPRHRPPDAGGDRRCATLLPLLARRARACRSRPLAAASAPNCARDGVGRRRPGSKLPRVSKAAPPAETPQPVPAPAPAGRDVRASRVYVLSRGPILASSGARSRSRRSSRSTSPGSRSASTSRSSCASSSAATATSSGACSGARALRSG